jgi:hypothetical protein
MNESRCSGLKDTGSASHFHASVLATLGVEMTLLAEVFGLPVILSRHARIPQSHLQKVKQGNEQKLACNCEGVSALQSSSKGGLTFIIWPLHGFRVSTFISSSRHRVWSIFLECARALLCLLH